MTALERVAVTFTGSPARLSTPHLYISSLATEFATGKVPHIWRDKFPNLPKVNCEGVSNHGGATMKLNIGSGVLAVAFSNDGSRFVCGSYARNVHIWDANTGVSLQILKGHLRCCRIGMT